MEQPKIFFSADAHINHANMITYDNESLEEYLGYKPRPYTSVEEMDEDIINKHNELVAPHDLVYFLGDVSFDKNIGRARSNILRMNGIKHLIYGNHRSTDEQLKDCYQWCKEYYELKVPDPDAHGGRQLICLFHYPVVEWNQAHRGSFLLFGHVHGKHDRHNAKHRTPEKHKTMDVGIMIHGMKPWSYDEIKEIMAKRSTMEHY